MIRAILAAFLILIPAAPAISQNVYGAGEAADLNCLIVSSLLASQEDEEIRQAGTLGTIYFTGKLLGRDPEFDMESRVPAVSDRISEEELNVAQSRCFAEFGALGDRLSRLGDSMQRQAAGN